MYRLVSAGGGQAIGRISRLPQPELGDGGQADARMSTKALPVSQSLGDGWATANA